jgi:O-acetyl-ADP-ribose deacetylase (regulator of RNase III)
MNTVLAERVLPTLQTIQLVRGDLTTETTAAIVNAANAHLQHGSGVAAAISRRGGPAIQQESDAWILEHGPISHAEPAWTSGGRLPAKYVIHAVGPVWGDGTEDPNLAAAVNGSLSMADELRLDSIALPAISTGIFGFPKGRAAGVIFTAINDYFAHTASGIQLVRVVLFDEETIQAFMAEWQRLA